MFPFSIAYAVFPKFMGGGVGRGAHLKPLQPSLNQLENLA